MRPQNIKHPSFVGKIKDAVRAAVASNYARTAPGVRGLAEVRNAKGRLSLYVRVSVGGALRFFDAEQNDVTSSVLSALRDFHKAA